MNDLGTVGRGDKRYLQQPRGSGTTWYVVVDVPRKLQRAFGAKRMTRSLNTDDLRLAQSRRWIVMQEFKAAIDALAEGDPTAVRTLHEQAIEAREAFVAARDAQEREDLHHAVMAVAEKLNGDLSGSIADEVVASPVASYIDVALGRATPVTLYIDRWLSHTTYTARTKGDARAALRELDQWLKRGGRPATIEGLTRRLAFDYRDDMATLIRFNAKTANKKLSVIRQYWAWLIQRDIISKDGTNPWAGTSFEKPKAHRVDPDGPDGEERPFTEDEIVRLLEGPADQDLYDLMCVGALTGMRLEEIGELTVDACRNGEFDVVVSKTAAGKRKVPIHSKLVSLISRRVDGKAGAEFLFPNLPASKGWDDKRTAGVSKLFTAYRRGLLVDDRRIGARRSKVNFHSFRRWFATMAEDAGNLENVVARTMGHKKGMEITFKTYSKASARDLVIACIESVQLPPHKPAENIKAVGHGHS